MPIRTTTSSITVKACLDFFGGLSGWSVIATKQQATVTVPAAAYARIANGATMRAFRPRPPRSERTRLIASCNSQHLGNGEVEKKTVEPADIRPVVWSIVFWRLLGMVHVGVSVSFLTSKSEATDDLVTYKS
jgi:hypothetical protein